ncbi:hypothetical protein NSMS1_63120 (plasmid) [Nostoc sp. MS1]|nr:hypothetical protein NSMS1_63120 [Nostoc sp. MS1]
MPTMCEATNLKSKSAAWAEGDRCWNPKVCHNRRSFYRNRTKDDSAQIEAIAIAPPETYFAVLYLYKDPGDKPLHALGAELWLGQNQYAA